MNLKSTFLLIIATRGCIKHRYIHHYHKYKVEVSDLEVMHIVLTRWSSWKKVKHITLKTKWHS